MSAQSVLLDQTSLLAIAVLSLGFLLSRRLSTSSRQRRQIDESSMRVHLALQRFRRQVKPGPDGLDEADIQSLRRRLNRQQRREWDDAMQAYQQARTDAPTDKSSGRRRYSDDSRITAELDRLLTISAQR